MELMPHVKALLDDLVSLTKNLIVKRTDIALANEGNDTSNTDLYYAYKKVVDGEMTFNSIIKSDIPYNVLWNIKAWSETNLNYYDLYPTEGTSVYQYTKDGHTITIRNICDSNGEGPEKEYIGELGDIYARQNSSYISTRISGTFAKLYSENFVSKYDSYTLYDLDTPPETYSKYDEETGLYYDEDNNILNLPASSAILFDDDGAMIFYDTEGFPISIYLRDNSIETDDIRKALREVKLYTDSEYITPEIVQSQIIGLNSELDEESFTEEDAVLYIKASIAKSNGEDPDVIYPGYSNLIHWDKYDYKYRYTVGSDGSYILTEYVHDNDIGSIRVKNVNDINTTVYYSRYYTEFYFADNAGVIENYVYLEHGATAPTYYQRSDELTYYQIPMPALGDDGDYLRDENEDILLDYNTGIYSTEEYCDEDIISEATVTYDKYVNTKSGLVDFDETFINDYGDEVVKYNTELVITTTGLVEMQNVSLVSSYNSSIDSHYCYYTVSDSGSYYLSNETGTEKYILIPEPEDEEDEYTGIRYEKHIIYTPTFFFVKSGDKYVESDSFISNNTYFYYNDDTTYYKCTRLFTTDQINKIRKSDVKDLTDDVKQVILEEYCEYIKDTYAKLRDDPELSVTRYDGEKNAYYRSLNGLPPVDELDNQPRVDRYAINSNYSGDEPNPYVYNLTDEEVDIITENGMLDNFKSIYKDADYLYHLGRNRIDVLKARGAGPFEILKYGSYENENHLKIFNEAYLISKNYIIHNYYKPEMFDVNEYYGSFIGMIILIHAMQICMSQSSDILVYNKYSDYDTVQLKLSSFGFDSTFDNIPLIYRKNIAKNIELLIKNKGIDIIYDIIYDVFGINNAEVYKYYIRKVHKQDEEGNYLYKTVYDEDTKKYVQTPIYEISMVQVPIHTDSVTNEIINPDNAIDYDTITNSDKYWGVYESKEAIKEMLENYTFNYMNSKYITINNKFNLSELNFSSSYYLNYLFELLKGTKYEIDIDEFENPQNLKNLIVTLFAIQAIKYGYNGDIPNDIVSTAAVYKFNLNDEVTITGKDAATKSKLIEIIDKYYTLMSNRRILTDDDLASLSANELYVYNTIDRLPTVSESEAYWRGKGKANNIKNCIIDGTKPPLILPEEITDDNALDQISDAYLQNLIEDDRLTSITDENSFYNMIKKYRDDAKSYNDYICFDKLLQIISTSKIVNDCYTIDPVWEEVVSTNVKPVTINDNPYTMVYEFQKEYYTSGEDDIEDKINACWKYSNIQDVWSVMTTDEINKNEEFIAKLDDCLNEDYTLNLTKAMNEFYVCNDVPELNKLASYQFAIRLGSDIQRSELLSHKWYIEDENGNMILDLLFSDNVSIYTKTSLIPMYVSMLDGGIPLTSKYISDVCLWTEKKLTVAEGCPIVYMKIPPSEYTGVIIPGMYYVYVYDNELGDNTCTFKMYRYTTTAFTYEMYLKYKAPDLYDYIQYIDSEDYSNYLTKINNLYSTIIASIDNSLSSENIRDQLNLNLIDFSNIAKYIKILINVFKSYTVDLASMDAVYSVDDKTNNRVKSVDKLIIEENSRINSNSHLHSGVSFHEGIGVSNRLNFRDEIIIE